MAFKLSEMQCEVHICVKKTQKQRCLNRDVTSEKSEEKRKFVIIDNMYICTGTCFYLYKCVFNFPHIRIPWKNLKI